MAEASRVARAAFVAVVTGLWAPGSAWGSEDELPSSEERDVEPTAASTATTSSSPGDPVSPADTTANPTDAAARWCAPELEELADEVCVFSPTREASGPRTLVISLHGVISPNSGWQWAQQRGAARIGARYGATVLMPHGRQGIGPKGMESWWAWPTADAMQKAHEDALIAQWDAARATLEQRDGRRFERVFVFGFSNGAYYATSLALRGKLPVDGYAVFAGGSGAKYLELAGQRTKQRAPIFVAWGGKDKAHRDQQALASLLKRLKWPSASLGAPRAGHTVTDAQVTKAMAFLSGKEKATDAGRPEEATSQQGTGKRGDVERDAKARRAPAGKKGAVRAQTPKKAR
ncbi:alpha/beta hydrolase [Chondromyces crocatus]|uniref:Dienelactone hydrolase domain-containing protein n=1 Tax=Chondromyces crocatus TaxID=52 RepID=A0A0K1E9W5_CHOCO|nr:dienelactone hydrolase family protein [Chondromyces crocatus]AKT37666.1 uncharacterized protein CMC5_018080 [Chondromyces crocatus]